MLGRGKAQEFKNLLDGTKKIVVLQPDPPQVDPDSIRSALAIGMLLEDQGKEVVCYLSSEIPKVFKIIPGSDRFTQDFPEEYDVSILVDCGSVVGQLSDTVAKYSQAFKTHPFVIMDHHANRVETPFSTVDVVDPEAVSAGELIYNLAVELGWKISPEVAEHLIWSIFEDSSLENSEFLALSERYETLVEVGELAKISKISVHDFFARDEEARSLPIMLFNEKRKLLNRLEFYHNNRLACLFVSKEEEEMFSGAGLDSPGYMVRPEIRKIKEVVLYVVLTESGSGEYRGSVRSKGMGGAVRLARHFGGGGHDQAAGFMVGGRSQDELRKEIVETAEEILG